jgi:alpha-beta hydrolase superfamily lysophospholipase
VGERHTIRDHRGRKVELSDYKSLPREMPAEVRREVGRASAQQLRNIVWAMVGGSLGSLIVPLVMMSRMTAFDLIPRLAGAAVVAAIIGGWWLWRGNTRAAAAIRRCVTWGACPSCGYPLGSARVAEDGCRVCSECGAAWRRCGVLQRGRGG